MAKKQKTPAQKIGGPYLAAAIFCETILDGADKSLTAIRIHDGTLFTLHHDAPADMPSQEKPVVMKKSFLLAFKSGDSPGKHRLQVVTESPSGKRTEAINQDVELEDTPAGGLNIKNEAHLGFHLSGVYWFDIMLDGKLMTRMPFNIMIEREKPPAPEAAEVPKKALTAARSAKRKG
jgi:hypothetical protein